jgi:hypothetical protein
MERPLGRKLQLTMTIDNLSTYINFMLTRHWTAAQGAKATLLTTTFDNLSTSFYFMLTRHWPAAQGAKTSSFTTTFVNLSI